MVRPSVSACAGSITASTYRHFLTLRVPKMENGVLIFFSSRPANAAQRIWVAPVVAGAALMLACFAPRPAFAVPANGLVCVVTSYYSTAKKVTKVGLFSRCPGSKETGWGKKTAFSTTLTVQTGIRGDTHSPVLTCEVIDQQFTCTANPITRAQ